MTFHKGVENKMIEIRIEQSLIIGFTSLTVFTFYLQH